MTLIPLSPPPGLACDETTFSAEGRWADGNNVRFVNGKPQVIGGWLEYVDLPDLVSSIGYVRSMFMFDRSGVPTMAYGTGRGTNLAGGAACGLYVTAPNIWNGALNNRSPAGLAATIDHWSLAAFGTVLLAAPRNGTLYEQSGVATATEVVQAPDQITSMIVTPERQVLALGCNEEVSGTYNGLCIRGSDLEDYTDWTTASDNNAFEHILEAGSGTIVAGAMVGSMVAVWTQGGLYAGQFIGDPAQTYRFDPIGTGCGLIGPAAFVEARGAIYWMSPDLTLWTWTPGATPTPIPCPFQQTFRQDINLAGRSKVVLTYVPKYQEIWIFYSSDGAENDRYLAYCLNESIQAQRAVWYKGMEGRTAAVVGGLVSTALAEVSSTKGQFLAADTSGNLLVHENGDLVWNLGSSGTWHIQSADFYLNESQKRMMVRGIIPDFNDQVGDITLTLYMRDRPQSTPVTKGPHTLATTATKKDFRASGKVMAVRFSGSSATGSGARFGKPLFDAVPMGDR